MSKKYVMVYGSLREGEYNYEGMRRVYGEDNIKKIKSDELHGFTLHSLGPYPTIIPNGGVDSNPIVVDVLEVSREVNSSIYNMEIGAGYERKVIYDDIPVQNPETGETEILNNTPISFYIMNNLPVYAEHRIVSGDWSKRDEEEPAIEETVQ